MLKSTQDNSARNVKPRENAQTNLTQKIRNMSINAHYHKNLVLFYFSPTQLTNFINFINIKKPKFDSLDGDQSTTVRWGEETSSQLKTVFIGFQSSQSPHTEQQRNTDTRQILSFKKNGILWAVLWVVNHKLSVHSFFLSIPQWGLKYRTKIQKDQKAKICLKPLH